jgi:DNA-binding HxlR family transcriptional regulator
MRERTTTSVLSGECVSQQILGLITGKWTAIVVYALDDGPRRYAELRRLIDGVSEKMLSQTLQKLERNGLVARRPASARARGVEYGLTAMGRRLGRAMCGLCTWAEAHAAEVLRARERYDAARPARGGRPDQVIRRTSFDIIT